MESSPSPCSVAVLEGLSCADLVFFLSCAGGGFLEEGESLFVVDAFGVVFLLLDVPGSFPFFLDRFPLVSVLFSFAAFFVAPSAFLVAAFFVVPCLLADLSFAAGSPELA